jgi:hypothetical protein
MSPFIPAVRRSWAWSRRRGRGSREVGGSIHARQIAHAPQSGGRGAAACARSGTGGLGRSYMPVRKKSLSEVEPHDAAITRRQGEATRDDLKRKWPHHVALPAEKVRDPVNREVIFCAAGVLSAAPLTIPCAVMTATSWCFAKSRGAVMTAT